MDIVYEVGQMVVGNTLLVKFSNGTVKEYDAVQLGCEWFKMSNDVFYSMYGFNFNPHKWGLYEKCRKLVHGDKVGCNYQHTKGMPDEVQVL